MESDKNILIAFILNFAFSIFEFIGGFLTGSVAIASDAIHDMGDALTIGISYFLEKQSRKKATERYTYGFGACSVIGSVVTTVILIVGSVMVISNAVTRLLVPENINYDGMIVFAVIGVIVNSFAAFFTRSGESLNQKAVNLHMLEDVLAWAAVLVGAFIMRFTDLVFIDPLLSIAVAVFILINASRNFKYSVDIFLEKVPDGIEVSEIKQHLEEIDGIKEVHHIHIRSIDGRTNCATMHIVSGGETESIKRKIRSELAGHGIDHVTLEFETPEGGCGEAHCTAREGGVSHRHRHHHH